MSTPPNPTRTRHPEREPGAKPGLGGLEQESHPTPMSRPRPAEDATPGVGGGWGRQDGEAEPAGPQSGLDGYE